MAYVHLGRLNIFAALTIAFVKATLIILYFMHVRYSSRPVVDFRRAGFFWLGIMFVLSFVAISAAAGCRRRPAGISWEAATPIFLGVSIIIHV